MLSLRSVVASVLNCKHNCQICTIEQYHPSNDSTTVGRRLSVPGVILTNFAFVSLEMCQTQSSDDAQQLADTLQILTVLIPHVYETILVQVIDRLHRNSVDRLERCSSISHFYLIYLGVYRRNTRRYDSSLPGALVLSPCASLS